MWRRVFSLVITLSLVLQQVGFAQVGVAELNLGGYLTKAPQATNAIFRLPHLRYFSYDVAKDNIRVMIDKGDIKDINGAQLQSTTNELFNYFLIGITLPNDTFWVNLRPDTQDKIIDKDLAATDMGKVMLEADLQLKKDISRFTSPQTPEGKQYWDALFKKASEIYGSQQVDLSTITRPWIVPNEIIVREAGSSAYIYKATLKVMLEQDCIKDKSLYSGIYNFKDARAKQLNEYSSQLIREQILPKLTQEVNIGKGYAQLRQVYYSLILSRWFKTRFANSSSRYTSMMDRRELTNLTSKTPWSKNVYFQAYKKSFAEGEYNIKGTVNLPTGQVVRTYCSGGVELARAPMTVIPSSALASTEKAGVDVLATALSGIPVTMPAEKPTSQNALSIRGLEDLGSIIKSKNIKDGILALDYNMPKNKVGFGFTDNQRMVDSLATWEWAIKESGLQFFYILTSSGRPSGTGFEEAASLKGHDAELMLLLGTKGIEDIEIVLLPFDLNYAKDIINTKKSEAIKSGRKIIFMFENMRMYPEEQKIADPVKKEAFERKIIEATGKKVENLVYITEAFDKSHRSDDASIEMQWSLFKEEQCAAGRQLVEQSNKVGEFLTKVTGSLSVIGGGKKFDKLKSFGDLAKRVALSKGRFIVVGALANPVLESRKIGVGKSLMPTSDEDKAAVKEGLTKIRDTIRDFKLNLMLPKDFKVKGGDIKAQLTAEDEQWDIGPETINEIVVYINSLKKGDGLVVNGGAGVFEDDIYSAGTIAIVRAANEAAKRGAIVFFAGGDMSGAAKRVEQKIQETEPGWNLSPEIISSTAGGALLVALGKGIGNLIPVRAAMKYGSAREPLLNIFSTVTEAFPGAILSPTAYLHYIDTSVNGDDSNRLPALDLYQDKEKVGEARVLDIADGRRVDKIKLFYETIWIPLILLAEDIEAMGGDFPKEFQAAKKEKDVTLWAQKTLQEVLKNKKMPMVTSQDYRSYQHDPAALGSAAVDISSLVAIRTRQGDLLLHVPIFVKRAETAAIKTLNESIVNDAKAKNEKKPVNLLTWPKQTLIYDHSSAAGFLTTYTPLFFKDFSEGDFSKAKLLTEIINKLDPFDLINPRVYGITYDKNLHLFVSENDKEGAVGFGKDLERFRTSLYKVGEICFRLYYLANSQGKEIKPVPDKELQDAVIGFYARMYRHLAYLATGYFNNPAVFNSLMAEVGDYAQRMNKDLRAADAMELDAGTVRSAGSIIKHLEDKGVKLNSVEKQRVQSLFGMLSRDNDKLFHILQLADLLTAENFVQSFRHLKLDSPRKVLPSDMPLEAYDGTGPVGRENWAIRLAEDINAKEKDYIGRYQVGTRKIDGKNIQEKLDNAAKLAKEMLSEEYSKTSIKTTDGQFVTLTELVKNNRLTFRPQDQVYAQLDFQDTDKVHSAYEVHIYLDHVIVGVVYVVDIAEFEAKLKVALEARGRKLDNIPRPFIIVSKGESYFFSLRVDATPGGVEIGDQQLERAGQEGKWKATGPTLWKMLAKFNLTPPKAELGTAADELNRIKEIYKQVQETRLPKEGGNALIYKKDQIPKTMVLSGFNALGRHVGWAIPYFPEEGMMYVTPTSCSTNGSAHGQYALSAFAGSADVLGTTAHDYTTSDVGKHPFGHTANKATGAAKGVTLLLGTTDDEGKGQTMFTATRTPTGLVNGQVDIVGGSVFDLLVRLPNDIPEDLIRLFFARIAREFPQDIKVFDKKDKTGGKYLWAQTIAGQQTGTIVYQDFITRVAPGVYRVNFGYDNEKGYTLKAVELKDAAYADMLRSKQMIKIAALKSSIVEEGEQVVAPEKKGGIDFRNNALRIQYQPLGNFNNLSLKLSSLSESELVSFDVEQETGRIERMIASGTLPSGERIKELLAACAQKGQLDSVRERIMVVLVKMGMLEERQFCMRESSKEYKEALVLVDAL